MSDHIAAVRAQAEKEAESFYPKDIPLDMRAYSAIDFEHGAVWLASRLTREKIADRLKKDTHLCYPDGAPVDWEQLSDAILDLLTEE